MSTRILATHEELLQLLHESPRPESIMKLMPKWETVERIESLIDGYRAGILSPLETSELHAITELVPYIRDYLNAG